MRKWCLILIEKFTLSLQKHFLICPSFLMYYCPNLLPRSITGLVQELLLQLFYFE